MKKILSVVIALMLMTACLINVAAAGEPALTATIDKDTYQAGDVVNMTVAIDATFATYGLQIVYDESVMSIVEGSLKPVKATDVMTPDENGEFPALFLYSSFTSSEESGIVGVISDKDVTYAGTIFTVSFQLKEDAPAGSYEVGVSYKNAEGETIGNVTNAAKEAVNPPIQNATVVIPAPATEEPTPAPTEEPTPAPTEEPTDPPKNPETGDTVAVVTALATVSILGAALIYKKKF